MPAKSEREYRSMTVEIRQPEEGQEERKVVEVVAGDGARWIDECTSEYFVNARRCTDFFHVVS